MDELKAAVDRAALAAGGKNQLAKALGLSRAALYFWSKVPDKHLVKVEQLTGVPREELRPDLFRR